MAVASKCFVRVAGREWATNRRAQVPVSEGGELTDYLKWAGTFETGLSRSDEFRGLVS